jgi:hypothetical protein
MDEADMVDPLADEEERDRRAEGGGKVEATDLGRGHCQAVAEARDEQADAERLAGGGVEGVEGAEGERPGVLAHESEKRQ